MVSDDKAVIHIGFDDTDSLKGGCTTYLALAIISEISEYCTFLDYPRLIRNNPNIPWKTRGNGSIAITAEIFKKDIEIVKERILDKINEHYQEDENTNPGFVLIRGTIPREIEEFSLVALTKNLTIEQAENLAKKTCYYYYKKGNGRGLIGGLAAIGNQLDPFKEDFTFELLAYRIEENVGTKRKINQESVYRMDKQLSPNVFNNIDSETNKVLICPAGKDPVLFGLRGERPNDVLEAFSLIEKEEPLSGYCIFRTNQGTDQHFKYADSTIENFSVFKGEIEITEKPKTITGGHVFLKGKILDNGKVVNLAAFEPSKNFKKEIKQLIPKDKILAFGGMKYKKEFDTFSIHLEKCEILFLAEKFRSEAPFCPECSKRMTSDGYQKGYKCKKCGYKDKHLQKTKTAVRRELTKKLLIPPEQAQRHLVKPYRRYKIEQKTDYSMVEDWWKLYSKI